MIHRERLILVVALGTALAHLCAPVSVQAADDEAEGRRRFKRGQELFVQGKYLEAAHEFEAGYAAAARPKFFFNIGNSYRKAGDLAKAKRYYQQLLQAVPDFEKRAEVEANLKAIDDALSAGSEVPAPPVRLPTPDPAPPAAEAPAAAPAPPSTVRRVARDARTGEIAPSVMDTPPPTPLATDDDSDSLFKKPWFWGTVGAVLVGGGVAAYFGLRHDSSCPATICLTESKR